MELSNGISIALNGNYDNPQPNIELSEGTEKIEGAFFPRGKWRFPKDSEMDTLTKFAGPCSPSSVTLLKINPKLKDELRERISSNLLNPQAITSKKRREILNAFSIDLAENLELFSKIKLTEYRSTDIQITPPDQRSTAYNYKEKLYVGLHLDNHDRLELSKRQNSFQVFGVNLGENERYFNFLNLSAPQLYSTLQKRKLYAEFPAEQISSLIALYFDNFPDYPVIRVTLRPGDAYIATTQFVVHDGETAHSDHADVALLMSGRFDAVSY